MARDDRNSSGTSGLADLVVTGGMVGGGFAGWRWYKKQQFNQNVISRGEAIKIPGTNQTDFSVKSALFNEKLWPENNAIKSAVDDFLQGANTNSVRGLDSLADLIRRKQLNISGDDLLQYLKNAATNTDANGSVNELINKKIRSGLSAQEVISDLSFISKNSPSLYFNNTVRTFLRDVSGVTERLETGKSIQLHGLPPSVTPTMTRNKFTLSRIEKHRPALAQAIRDLERATKGKISLHGFNRPGLPGSELGISIYNSPFFRSRKHGPQFEFKVPLPLLKDPQVVIRGGSQQSMYLAGEFFEIEQLGKEWALKKKMHYDEWSIYKFIEQNVHKFSTQQKLGRREINSMLHEHNETVSKALEWINMLPKDAHPGQSVYLGTRKKRALLEKVGGEALTPSEYADVIKRGLSSDAGLTRVFPSASPGTMAHNIVSLEDWTQKMLFPGAFEWSKRPLQAVRRQYSPTDMALHRLTGRIIGPHQGNKIYQQFNWSSAEFGVPKPIVRGLYASGEHAGALARLGMNIEGHGLLASSEALLFQQNELVTREIASNALYGEMKSVLEGLGGLDKSEWMGNKTWIPDEIIGLNTANEPERGGFNLLFASRHQDRNKQDFVKLVGTREVLGEKFKVFGDVKAMLSLVEQNQIDKIYQSLAGNSFVGGDIFKPAGVFAMDELRKNRSLHYKQMFTALHDFTAQNMNRLGKSSIARQFYLNPTKTISRINAIADKTNIFSHSYALGEALRIARSAKLTPEQMGLTFGAVPDVFGFEAGTAEWEQAMLASDIYRKNANIGRFITEEEAMQQASSGLSGPGKVASYWKKYGQLSPEEAVAINKRIAIGMAELSYAGQFAPGSGKMATIEPRLLDFLDSPSYGAFGPAFKEDIARRMLHQYPERIAEGNLLGESAASMLNLSGNAGVLPSLFTDEMLDKGGLLNLPGVGDIKVPGGAQIRQMSNYTTSAGLPVGSELRQSFSDFLEQAKLFETGDLPREELLGNLNDLRAQVQSAQLGTIGHKGGLARSRLPGSMFFTPMPAVTARELGIRRGQVGITESFAERMLNQVADVYGPESIAGTMETLKRGGSVPGTVFRHPFIDTGSAALAEMKLIRGSEPYMVMGEDFVRAGVLKEGFQGEVLGSKLSDLGANVKDLGFVRRGTAVGMALDYDQDLAAAIMLPNHMHATARGSMMSAEASEILDIRMQLLKAKKAGGATGLTIHEAAAAAALKGTVTKTQLGQISEALSVARASIIQNTASIPNERMSNALGLLGWLEQQPISAKHIAAGQEEEMVSLFGKIKSSIYNRNRPELIQAISSVVGRDTVGEQFMTRGGEVVLEEANGLRRVNLPGIDIAQASEDIMTGLGHYNRKGLLGISPRRVRQMFRGKGAPISEAEGKILSGFGFKGMGPLSGFVPNVPIAADAQKYAAERIEAGIVNKGWASRLSEAAIAAENLAVKEGKNLRKFGKPIAIGLGALGLLGAATSVGNTNIKRPPSMTEQPEVSPQPNIRTGREGGEGMMPDTESVTLPPPPNIMGGQMLAPVTPTATRIHARVAARQGADYSVLNNSISNSLGGARVNTRVVDNRSSISPHSISRIMEDE